MADISQVKLPSGDIYNLVDETSGYIKNYTETDPIFSASAASGITATDISNWNTQINNISKYSDILSLSTKQTAEGLYCYTTITVPHDMFMVVPMQWTYMRPTDGAWYLRFEWTVPKEYVGHWKPRYIYLTKTTDDVEVTEENGTSYEPAVGGVRNSRGYFNGISWNVSHFENGKKAHVRGVIDILDDNDNIIRSIYSSQVTISNENGVYSYKNTAYTADNDSIVQGFLYLDDNKCLIQNDLDSSYKIYPLLNETYGAGSTYTLLMGLVLLYLGQILVVYKVQ